MVVKGADIKFSGLSGPLLQPLSAQYLPPDSMALLMSAVVST